jgi:hypothetical protein
VGGASRKASSCFAGQPEIIGQLVSISAAEPSCEAATSRAAISPSSTARDLASRMRHEKHARHQLAKWKRFSTSDRPFCGSEIKTGALQAMSNFLSVSR